MANTSMITYTFMHLPCARQRDPSSSYVLTMYTRYPPNNNISRYYYCSRLVDEKTKAQRSYITCPVSHKAI